MTNDSLRQGTRPVIKPAPAPEPIAFKPRQADHVPSEAADTDVGSTEAKPAPHQTMTEPPKPNVTTVSAETNAKQTEHDLVELSQAGFAAFSQTNQILVAGFKEFMDSQAAAAKASVDETLAAISSLTAAKTFKDVLNIQSGLLKSSLTRSLENHRLLTAASVRMTTQAYEPIKAQLAAVTSRT